MFNLKPKKAQLIVSAVYRETLSRFSCAASVSMLGKVLGDTIKDALGENILDRGETIRKLSKSSRRR